MKMNNTKMNPFVYSSPEMDGTKIEYKYVCHSCAYESKQNAKCCPRCTSDYYYEHEIKKN